MLRKLLKRSLYVIQVQQDMTANDLLKDYQNAPPLPTEINPDGKSLINLSGPKSSCYDTFPEPIKSSNNGFDFHSEHHVS